jgi:hypothetical protein
MYQYLFIFFPSFVCLLSIICFTSFQRLFVYFPFQCLFVYFPFNRLFLFFASTRWFMWSGALVAHTARMQEDLGSILTLTQMALVGVVLEIFSTSYLKIPY